MRDVERALELHYRGDRHVRAPRAERVAQGVHRAFEHSRRYEQVGPGVGMHLRDRREALESPGDVRAMLAEEHALTVRRVRTNADVGRDAELGHSFLHGADRARHDVVRFAREERVLVLTVADAEEEKPSESSRRGGTSLAHHLGERQSLKPRRGLDLLAVFDSTADDDRENDSTGEVRARKGSRPDRVLCEPPSCERRLSHDRMVRTIAEQAVTKGYHFTP